MASYNVTYLGGHPDLPRRVKGLTITISPQGIIGFAAGRSVHFQIAPAVVESVTADGMPFSGEFDRRTQELWRSTRHGMVVSYHQSDAIETLVWDVAPHDLPLLTRDIAHLMAIANGHSDAPMGAFWDAMYLGGHPRHSNPSRRPAVLTVAGPTLTVWDSDQWQFAVPLDTLHGVRTTTTTTQGPFFGIGAEGIVEATVANRLLRRTRHTVICTVVIDRQMANLAFAFPRSSDQQALYATLQKAWTVWKALDPTPEASEVTDLAKQLAALSDLHRSGSLTTEEFVIAKRRVLGDPAR